MKRQFNAEKVMHYGRFFETVNQRVKDSKLKEKVIKSRIANLKNKGK